MLELRGATLVLRTPDADREREALRTIHCTPAVAAWWGVPHPEFPDDDDPRVTCFTILRDGAIVGYLQFWEELEPDARYAGIDLFVDPAHHRQGIATEAIALAIEHLVGERGHHRITIDPAVDNRPAIRCYEAAGFRRVGVLEAQWRDTFTGEWRDALLMEQVVRAPAAAPGGATS